MEITPIKIKRKNGQEFSLHVDGAISFPGLINSHDHLDFDLFPQLKSRIYTSYTEWGTDIHRQFSKEIADVLKIPQELRIRWGIYKNLLNGITTVVHHGKKLDVQHLDGEQDLVTVCQDARSLHSPSGEKLWRLKLLNPFQKGRPVVIHVGEGTTSAAAAEIDELIKGNRFRRELIGIHGIAMNATQAASFQALIWCPDSNLFLYDRTAPIHRLKHHTKILFGTDSTLTASWNLWDHLRLARRQQTLTDTELFDSLTSTPAAIWELKDSASRVIARPPIASETWDAFYSLNPENILLVLHQGNINLFDPELLDQLTSNGIALDDFSRIKVNGQIKYVRGNLPALMEEIRQYHPSVHFPVHAS
jgi:cytosine/adenosine deaminase-related metal-dependent hydrolase